MSTNDSWTVAFELMVDKLKSLEESYQKANEESIRLNKSVVEKDDLIDTLIKEQESQLLKLSNSGTTKKDNITDQEAFILKDIDSLNKAYFKLPEMHPHDKKEWVTAIHDLQKIMALRIARRSCSEIFSSPSMENKMSMEGAGRKGAEVGNAVREIVEKGFVGNVNINMQKNPEPITFPANINGVQLITLLLREGHISITDLVNAYTIANNPA